jgi:hypothetical protein
MSATSAKPIILVNYTLQITLQISLLTLELELRHERLQEHIDLRCGLVYTLLDRDRHPLEQLCELHLLLLTDLSEHTRQLLL